ncbi:MAG: glycosyltransferase family 2 protein [Micrococcaceae bacterium]
MNLDTAWVVIPAFNEDAVLGDVIKHVLTKFKYVVVIDDNSTDNTAKVALDAGACVVTHPINLGQGAGLQTGFDFVKMQDDVSCVVTFDADGQHDLDDAAAMVELLQKENLDVVLGSRFLDDKTEVSTFKRIVLKAAAKWGAWTTGMKLTDAHNGLRVISRETLDKFHINQNKMAHASEIIDKFSELKVSYKEYPTHIRYTEYSKSKGQPLLNSVNILIDLIMK